MPSSLAIFKYLPRTLRVTKEGKHFILLIFITGFAALNTGNNLLYLLAAALLSLIVVSGLLSELSLSRVALTTQTPVHFSAGQPGAIRISLHNQKKLVPSFSLGITGLLQPAVPFISERRKGSLWWKIKMTLTGRSAPPTYFQEAYFIKVSAQKMASQLLQVTFPKRGCYRLEGFKLSTAFPFGLFIKSSAREDPRELWVYPKVHPISRELFSKAAMESAYVSERIGQAAGFNHFREYHLGDDRRMIHWKLSARQGRWIIKEREREEGGEWTLFFSNVAPAARTDAWNRTFERAIEEVASLAAFLLNAGRHVGLKTLSETIAPGEGADHLDLLLKRLALLEPIESGESRSHTTATGPDPAGSLSILVRMKEDQLWMGKESLFQAVVVIDADEKAGHLEGGTDVAE
jgi:uncharacterized protein (DUF58 family)